jgi:Flp pilus assembly protein TadG
MVHRNRRSGRTAAAAVELAVCFPFMLILLAGIWEVGRMVSVSQVISNAAREAGREVAAGQASVSTIQQNVVNYCKMNGLTGVTTGMVTIENVTDASRNDPATCNQLDQWRVTITVPYSVIRWSTIAQITPTTDVVATADWYSMRDSPVVVNAAIPTN